METFLNFPNQHIRITNHDIGEICAQKLCLLELWYPIACIEGQCSSNECLMPSINQPITKDGLGSIGVPGPVPIGPGPGSTYQMLNSMSTSKPPILNLMSIYQYIYIYIYIYKYPYGTETQRRAIECSQQT